MKIAVIENAFSKVRVTDVIPPKQQCGDAHAFVRNWPGCRGRAPKVHRADRHREDTRVKAPGVHPRRRLRHNAKHRRTRDEHQADCPVAPSAKRPLPGRRNSR